MIYSEILQSLLFLLLLGTFGFYWWDSAGAREVAVGIGRKRCQEAQVQFLDDTVVQKKVLLQRNEAGQLQIVRQYLFEFTSDGEDRYSGRILLAGRDLRAFQMDAYRIGL